MIKLEIVKEFKNLIPPLTKEEYSLLEQNILKDGIRDPLVLWGDMICDGHNRFEIANKHNLEFKTINKEFDSVEQVKIWIIENQLGRRNLNESQRAMIAARLSNLDPHRPKLSPPIGGPSISQQEAGKLLNVGERSVSRAKKIIDYDDEEMINEINSGKLSVSAAVEEIKKDKNQKYQEKESQLKDTSKIVIDNIVDRYSLYNYDLLNAPVKDNSLDAIITDPPYTYEFINCWKSLAEFATKKLKDGGILIAMSGQSYLPEVYSNMNIEGLNYYWTCCIQMTVSPNLYQKRLQTQWKPLLFYVKGNYNRTHLKSDVFNPIYSDTIEGQKYHKWGQGLNLMRNIIERFTYTNELICDPFAGGNTTIMAGLELKRRMIGIEINEVVYNDAKKRLEDYFNENWMV